MKITAWKKTVASTIVNTWFQVTIFCINAHVFLARNATHVKHAHDDSKDTRVTYRLLMASLIFSGLSRKSLHTTAEVFDKT